MVGFMNPIQQENAWSDGLRCDTAGRVYVTSTIGHTDHGSVGKSKCNIALAAIIKFQNFQCLLWRKGF